MIYFIITITHTSWKNNRYHSNKWGDHYYFFIRIPILYLATFWSTMLTKPMFWLQHWNWIGCCSWIYFVPTPKKSLWFIRFRRSYVNHPTVALIKVLLLFLAGCAVFKAVTFGFFFAAVFSQWSWICVSYFCWAHLLLECC